MSYAWGKRVVKWRGIKLPNRRVKVGRTVDGGFVFSFKKLGANRSVIHTPLCLSRDATVAVLHLLRKFFEEEMNEGEL